MSSYYDARVDTSRDEENPELSSSDSSETSTLSFYDYHAGSDRVTCPSNAKPGTLVKVDGLQLNGTASNNNALTSKYVAVPEGILPGESFHVAEPLTTGQIKQVFVQGTAPGYASVELELTRSLVMQEVKGVFLNQPRSTPGLCCSIVRRCAASSCLHPFCFCFGCSSDESREFLLKDGHSEENDFLYLVKERSEGESCLSTRRSCAPNHPLTLEAYRLLPLTSPDGVLRPDVRRGPEFTVDRHGYCLLSCFACCIQNCKHRFYVHDRNLQPGAGDQPGDIIGLGYQQTCGGSPCYDCTPEAMCCLTPTVAVMRRDTVMTAAGWGESDSVLGILEGPCCCYGGWCCEKRKGHWFFSDTQGKAFDVGAMMLSDVSRHHIPARMNHLLVGEPVLMEFTKRNLSQVDKKLAAATMLVLNFMFLRSKSQGVVCCNFHCCGANCQC